MPKVTDDDEKNLTSFAKGFKLINVNVGEQIRNENARVFRYHSRTSEKEKSQILGRIQEHQAVQLAGPVITMTKDSLSILTNELVVKFKVDVTKEKAYAITKKLGVNILRSIPYSRNAYHMSLGKLASYSILDTCEKFVKTGLVEYAEPNLYTTTVLDYTPNDFLFGQQPHHTIINSEGAWDITSGDEDIILAVVDAGCDIDHPDFTNDAALGWNKVYRPYDFTNMDNDPTLGSHGTKSCGIATANFDNNEGAAGVAPGCRLMPIRYPTGADLQHADAYVWIAGFDPNSTTAGFPAQINPGADVISNSFGKNQAAISGIMQDALDFITTFGRNGRGCVVVYSVANDNIDFTTQRHWAAHEKTIAVASSAISPPDAAEVKVSTSSYGLGVDVCAPGGGPGGGAETRTLSTTNVGTGDTAGSAGAATNDYDDFGQTSCACPQVAGTAALMLSANPDLTWVQVREILRETAVRIDTANVDFIGQWQDLDGDGVNEYSQWYGYGRIDVQAAVQAAQDLVGVDPLDHIDTWIMENSTDIGDVPSLPPYSPDVWVRNTDPAVDNPAEVTIHQSPIRNQNNWVYAKIRNRGTVDSHDVYVRLSITRWAGTQYIYPEDFVPTTPPSTFDPAVPMAPGTYLIGEVHIDSIPAGGSVMINTVWPPDLIPPSEVVIDGTTYSWADSCLLVEVSPHDGPTPTGNHTWDNNNLCQRNITIVDPGDDDDAAIAFVVGNRYNYAKMLNVRIDRRNLPAGVKLQFDYVYRGTTKAITNLLEEAKKGVNVLKTCDLTLITEAKGELSCPSGGNTVPVVIDKNTMFTFPACHIKGRDINYKLQPVTDRDITVFALPTVKRTYVPILRKGGEYQVVALRMIGLRDLKPGDYQIDIYQETVLGMTEGGVNFIIRKE
jgi:subtilisin family serine protease